MIKKRLGFFTLALFGLIVTTNPTAAQLRSQGKELTFTEEEENKTLFSGPLVDYASEMRKLIQNIAKYGRTFKRDFVVIVKDAKGLMTQIVDIDQLIYAPSSAYLKSIDGLMESSISYGAEGYGVATNTKDQKGIMEQLNIAQETGLKIFSLDYVSKPKDVDKAIRFARKNKFTPYAAPGMGFRNNKLPKWPKRPTKENSHTVSNVQMVKNYVFVEESSRFGRPEEYAMKIHNTNYDMVVTNVFHHRSQTLGRNNVRTMQFKKLGSRRPVLAHINIGYADAGAYYWKDDWREGNPTWVLEPAAFSTDQHLVQYWHPSWHQVLYGNTQSFLYGIMKEGYDGIVIDGANVYEVFANPD